MFKIQSDVPLPPPDFGGANKERVPYVRYPFDYMKVGDSFLAVGVSQVRLVCAAAHHKKRRARDGSFTTFATRLDPNTGHPRVWRTS